MQLRTRIPTDPDDRGPRGTLSRLLLYLEREDAAGRAPSAPLVRGQVKTALYQLTAGPTPAPRPMGLLPGFSAIARGFAMILAAAGRGGVR